jgi:hypothetical protein
MAHRCAVCGKEIGKKDPHYRRGLAWYHVDCYETLRKKPERQ